MPEFYVPVWAKVEGYVRIVADTPREAMSLAEGKSCDTADINHLIHATGVRRGKVINLDELPKKLVERINNLDQDNGLPFESDGSLNSVIVYANDDWKYDKYDE